MPYTEITWPATLPQKPQKTSYEETVDMGQLISSTDFDAGPSRQRRRSTALPTRRTCLFILTETQKGTLYQFLDENLGRSFWFPDPTGTGYVYVRVASGSQVSFKPWNDTLSWQITLTLDVWPFVTRSE